MEEEAVVHNRTSTADTPKLRGIGLQNMPSSQEKIKPRVNNTSEKQRPNIARK